MHATRMASLIAMGLSGWLYDASQATDPGSSVTGKRAAGIAFAAAWAVHNAVTHAYTVPASCQVVTFPEEIQYGR